jgi:anaerobic ribonucleoside-triphosphate reductase
MVINTLDMEVYCDKKLKNLVKVYKRDNLEKFDAMKIYGNLMKETSMTKSDAVFVVNKVAERIKESKAKIITPREIRGMSLSVLIENGYEEAYKDYTTIGVPVFDIKKLLVHGNNENANVSHSPMSIIGSLGDDVLRGYTRNNTLPPHLMKAHDTCEIHIHELNFFELGLFCQAHDPRIILKYGLPPSKKIKNYKFSKPSKNMKTTCLHLANWFSYTQSVFSGGQGYLGFNTILAPYARGMSDYEVKNALEAFVYQVNQQRDSRNHQVPFTSIDMNLGIDPSFKDCHAIVGGKLLNETYADFEPEAVRIVELLAEIFKQGDSEGIPWSFPKFELKVTNEKISKYSKTWDKIIDLIATNGAPYIMNGNLLPESAQCQCCRIIFNPDGTLSKFCIDPKKYKPSDTNFPNFGAYQSISINLPRVAIDAEFREERIYKIIDDRLEKMAEVLAIKIGIMKRNKEFGFPALYWTEYPDGKNMIDFDLQSCVVGYVGLNEMVQNLIGEGIENDVGHELGRKILQYIADWCERTSVRMKMSINMWEQPAESTAGTFAKYDVAHFGDKKIAYRGSGDSVYYTNSGHIPYHLDISLARRLKLQGDYHPIVKGGVISHIWLGEVNPDREAIAKLVYKILNETSNYYFAISKDHTICNDCGWNHTGFFKKCSKCNSVNLDWINRITGYYSRYSHYNESKKSEFDDRHREKFLST